MTTTKVKQKGRKKREKPEGETNKPADDDDVDATHRGLSLTCEKYKILARVK